MSFQFSLDRLGDLTKIAPVNVPDYKTAGGCINLVNVHRAHVSQQAVNVLSKVPEPMSTTPITSNQASRRRCGAAGKSERASRNVRIRSLSHQLRHRRRKTRNDEHALWPFDNPGAGGGCLERLVRPRLESARHIPHSARRTLQYRGAPHQECRMCHWWQAKPNHQDGQPCNFPSRSAPRSALPQALTLWQSRARGRPQATVVEAAPAGGGPEENHRLFP